MDTLKNKTASGNANLQDLTSFVENTKNGNFTKDFPIVESITLGRVEFHYDEINSMLPHLDGQFLLMGISY